MMVRSPKYGVNLLLLAVVVMLSSGARISGETSGSVQNLDPKPQQAVPADVNNLSIEELMNITVTSVSKKEQPVSQAAAAIYVITGEDIRDSGATTIPDLLRMVPGVDVSQINANTWAVSVRGFNTQFANKLLVLVDGRAVYSPTFGGVYWDVEDVPFEDIDRIEVIRGPGATLWGANAVNGVINIITKKAADTAGSLVVAGGGTSTQAFGTTQYGGKIGPGTDYRVFTKYLNNNHFPDLTNQNAQDDWHLLHGGLRVDQSISKKDSLSTGADLYAGGEGSSIGHLESITPPVVTFPFRLAGLSGGNVTSRWNHGFSSRSDTSLQFYFDDYTRSGPESRENRHTFDFDFNHHLAAGARQDVVWGAGYRWTSDRTVGTIDQAWVPASRSLRLGNFFGQDSIILKPNRFVLTVGTKIEHNDFTGFEIQPSVRMAWTPGHRQTFWVAASRASRTPTRKDSNAKIALFAFLDPNGTPVEVISFGDPNGKSEHLAAYEAGYRTQLKGRISVDIASFFNSYNNLASFDESAVQTFVEALPPPPHQVLPFHFDNDAHGTACGGEVAVRWKVLKGWNLSSSYSLLQMHLHGPPASEDPLTIIDVQGSNPPHQAQLRSHLEFGRGFAWDAAGYFVGPRPFQLISSHTRVDTQLSWQLAHDIRLSLVGQNLLQDHHAESNDFVTSVNPSAAKRGVYAKVVWHHH